MVFTLNVILNPELQREILSFGPGLEVLRPRILRKHVAEAIRAAAQMYEQE
jgi:predicted DNA-binding transcriptional regulator YafY